MTNTHTAGEDLEAKKENHNEEIPWTCAIAIINRNGCATRSIVAGFYEAADEKSLCFMDLISRNFT